RVIRALLVRPVLRAQTDGELFRLARRHADALTGWFDREAGWRLVTEAQTVRLIRSYIPSGPTAVAIGERHPARSRRRDPAFTRRHPGPGAHRCGPAGARRVGAARLREPDSGGGGRRPVGGRGHRQPSAAAGVHLRPTEHGGGGAGAASRLGGRPGAVPR